MDFLVFGFCFENRERASEFCIFVHLFPIILRSERLYFYFIPLQSKSLEMQAICFSFTKDSYIDILNHI